MQTFQFIQVNADGTLKIEYPVYVVEDIQHPVDANGAPLKGQALIEAVESYAVGKTPVSANLPIQADLTDVLELEQP